MPTSVMRVAATAGLPRAVAVVRLLIAALVVAAIVATVVEAAGRVTVNPFNLFGYFTIQSNIIVAVIFAVAGARILRGRVQPAWMPQARAAGVTYIAVVGIVYAVLLAPLGVAGGVPVPWANFVLHVLTPLYAVADWLVSPDRRRLPFARTIGAILLYPLAWCAVVLARGATDGWVPYPFLDPGQGYEIVAFYVVLIAGTVTVVGALVVAASRLTAPRPELAF